MDDPSPSSPFSAPTLVVMRTPLLPVEELLAWGEGLAVPTRGEDAASLEAALTTDRERLRERLRALIERPEIREALFVASPDLAASLRHWLADPDGKKGRRAEQGLVRYVQRMATRPTPFGLFAGTTAGAPGERTRLRLGSRQTYGRQSRLDMDYLFALSEHLGRDPALRPHLVFRPNSSLCRIAGRWRYAEARVDGRLRTCHWVAVDAFEEVDRVLELAAGGARLGDLAVAFLAEQGDEEADPEEVRDFLTALVDHQLLLPDLTPTVTGRDATEQLIDDLANLAARAREEGEGGEEGEQEGNEEGAGSAGTAAVLEGVRQRLAALDATPLGNPPQAYREVAAALAPLGVAAELPRLFQVDLIKPAEALSLGPEVVAEIVRGVEILHRLARPPRESSLTAFATAFVERYGDGATVPLLVALDEEAGVGFERSGVPGAEASHLLEGLGLWPRGQMPQVPWDRRETVLLSHLVEVWRGGSRELEVTAEMLRELSVEESLPLPDAFQVMATLITPEGATLEEAIAEGTFQIHLHTLGGPSGARLLGRFCQGDAAIHTGVREHLEAEEAVAGEGGEGEAGEEKGPIFAEVVHLPSGRIGNILARPVLRGFEIPFLGRSGAPAARQIPLSDLYVTVVRERVVLTSGRLGRRVIPRLSTAHNTSRESLGAYRFLAALQFQGRAAFLGWGWGALESAPFLPRVRHGRLILARARWRVEKGEIAPLLGAEGAKRQTRVRAWRRRRDLPREVMLVDGDNELWVDFENVLSLESFLALVKERPELVLREVCPAPGELCAEGPEGHFFHELIVPFVRRPRPAKPEARPSPTPRPPTGEPGGAGIPTPPTVVRRFAPGSRWLFAKLYCGTATGDRILAEAVAPLAEELLAAGEIRRWFFIRYGDPQWHLRVRFEGEPDRLRQAVEPRLTVLFARLLGGEAGAGDSAAAGGVWKVQLDTYEREVERYGGPEGIELAEEIFFHDSRTVVALLGLCGGDRGARQRWQLTLAGMDRLFDDFSFPVERRLAVAEAMGEGLGHRFREEGLRARLADRLRAERPDLEAVLGEDGARGGPEWEAGLAVLAERSRALAPVVEELTRRDRAGRLRPALGEIVPSLVHMFVNRACRSAGPEHERVLYDFLARLYASRLARARSGRPPATPL